MADGATKMRAVRFSRGAIIGAISAGALFLIALTYGSSRLIAGYLTRDAMTVVLDQNATLRQQLDVIETRLTSVNQSLGVLAESDNHLRLMADLPKIDKDIREVGVGGAVTSSADYGIQDPKVKELIEDIDKIEREISLQSISYEEIEKRMAGRGDLLAHTPSIRPMVTGYIGSRFGRRKDPINGRSAFHQGLDISCDRGTPVLATADGRVAFSQASPGLGKLVIIDHGYGFRTAYGHLSSFSVSKGQTVKRGQRIGLSGATGRATGPHLHYEVHVNGDAVNPLDFIFDDNQSLAEIAKE